MPSLHHARRLNMPAFAAQAEPLNGRTLLQNMERLAQENTGLQADKAVDWEARAELRPGTGTDDDIWLHLQATTSLTLICQRCMGPVEAPVAVDQWYRFVATEEIAMAQDDDAEEDLLVLEPQFDLLAVLEDELLMALPVVPMHAACPVVPPMQAGELGAIDDAPKKPNPFAVLAQLKNTKQ